MLSDSSVKDPSLSLKSLPPRTDKSFLDRKRLKLTHVDLGDQISVLCAPTGYGKSSQLSQWRKEALASGFLTFWYTIDERDEPLKFVKGLTVSAKASCGNRGFNSDLTQWIEDRSNPREALAGWLAEVASLSVNVLLLLDDLDFFPVASRNQVLTYLLGNVPPNLHIVMASRDADAFMAMGAHSSGIINRITVPELCFRLDETMKVLSSVLDVECTPELGVYVHELTEGWPLGVKLAAASLKRGDSVDILPATALDDVQGYFVDTVINRLPKKEVDFLVRLSQFDLIHPDFCNKVLGFDLKPKDLHRFQDEVPLLMSLEGGSWVYLHPLAKSVLLKRLEGAPLSERRSIAEKASYWYEKKELYEEASKQALIAGDTKRAIALVENSTHTMTIQGKSVAVLKWFERMDPEERHKHPGFLLPAAWALAMSSRSAEAAPLLDLVLNQPNLDTNTKFEVALINAAVAGYEDDVDKMELSLDPWPFPYTKGLPPQACVHANSLALNALVNGQPDLARNFHKNIEGLDIEYSPVAAGYAAFGNGLSYLWEGRFASAEKILRPALARAEKEMGRRNPVTCSLAALLAQASFELGLEEDLNVLLLDRLPILDSLCVPEALMAAYKTLSRLADYEGRQDDALTLLESLETIGKERSIIRFVVAAKYEFVCLHAKHNRIELAREISDQLQLLVKDQSKTLPKPISKWLRLHSNLAQAHVLLAQESRAPSIEAISCVQVAVNTARSLKRGRDLVEAQLVRAELLFQMGDIDAKSIKEEALSLAQAEQMVRLLNQHSHVERIIPVPDTVSDATNAAIESPSQQMSTVKETALLTPKESDVLTFLSRNFSNKEIARAMDISVETVKWHVKNLFSKLNAADRKHVVARAKLLGLIIEVPI